MESHAGSAEMNYYKEGNVTMASEKFKEAMAQHTALRQAVEDMEEAEREAADHWKRVGQLPEYAQLTFLMEAEGLLLARYQTGHHALIVQGDIKKSILFEPGE